MTAADGSDATPIPATSPATTWTLTADSVARYRAQEELADRGANEAVGETNSIVGQIYFDHEGMPLACSRWDVDLRTLTSDESRRDNYLRGNTLQTDTYPVATFVLTSVDGLDRPLQDGQETAFSLVGNLTMHGVTKLVRWDVTAKLDGDAHHRHRHNLLRYGRLQHRGATRRTGPQRRPHRHARGRHDRDQVRLTLTSRDGASFPSRPNTRGAAMARIKDHPFAQRVAAVALIVLIAIVSFATYLAAATGSLPWQDDPTRIPVTPFNGIPGFTPPTPLPTATTP